MAIYCIWLEDQDATANGFQEVLKLENVNYHMLPSQSGFFGYLADPEADFHSEDCELVALIDLKIYENERRTSEFGDVDLGLQVIAKIQADKESLLHEKDICIITERAINADDEDDFLVRAKEYGITRDFIFQKYEESELVRFRDYIRGKLIASNKKDTTDA